VLAAVKFEVSNPVVTKSIIRLFCKCELVVQRFETAVKAVRRYSALYEL